MDDIQQILTIFMTIVSFISSILSCRKWVLSISNKMSFKDSYIWILVTIPTLMILFLLYMIFKSIFILIFNPISDSGLILLKYGVVPAALYSIILIIIGAKYKIKNKRIKNFVFSGSITGLFFALLFTTIIPYNDLGLTSPYQAIVISISFSLSLPLFTAILDPE